MILELGVAMALVAGLCSLKHEVIRDPLSGLFGVDIWKVDPTKRPQRYSRIEPCYVDKAEADASGKALVDRLQDPSSLRAALQRR